jgi:hypothetical protein
MEGTSIAWARASRKRRTLNIEHRTANIEPKPSETTWSAAQSSMFASNANGASEAEVPKGRHENRRRQARNERRPGYSGENKSSPFFVVRRGQRRAKPRKREIGSWGSLPRAAVAALLCPGLLSGCPSGAPERPIGRCCGEPARWSGRRAGGLFSFVAGAARRRSPRLFNVRRSMFAVQSSMFATHTGAGRLETGEPRRSIAAP